MNGALFLQKRSRRHMARLLEQYETLVVPHLPAEARSQSERFKGVARDTLKEFTGDACDVVDAVSNGMEINGAAVELRDRIARGAS